MDYRVTQILGVWLPLFILVGCSVTPETTHISPPINTTVAPDSVPVPSQAGTITTTPLKIMAVGDIMLGTDYPDDRLAEKDGADLLQHVAPVLKTADIVFGNLEGVLIDGGEPEKQCTSHLSCYVFRMPTRYAQYLAQAGFSVVSLANNHARDFGETGRSSTMATLDKLGIRHSGLEGDVAKWQVQGQEIALIAFSPFRGSHNMLNLEQAQQFVRILKRQAQIVFVSMHAGAEGADATKLPFATEYFHGEERGDEVAFAHAVIDAGADMVIGHGPHVARALELYKGRLVAYSLGNFCTSFGINVSGINGLAPILEAEISPTGEFIAGRVVSTRQVRPGGPQLDPRGAAGHLIAKLTKEDFPDGAIELTADGQILRKHGR